MPTTSAQNGSAGSNPAQTGSASSRRTQSVRDRAQLVASGAIDPDDDLDDALEALAAGEAEIQYTKTCNPCLRCMKEYHSYGRTGFDQCKMVDAAHPNAHKGDDKGKKYYRCESCAQKNMDCLEMSGPILTEKNIRIFRKAISLAHRYAAEPGMETNAQKARDAIRKSANALTSELKKKLVRIPEASHFKAHSGNTTREGGNSGVFLEARSRAQGSVGRGKSRVSQGANISVWKDAVRTLRESYDGLSHIYDADVAITKRNRRDAELTALHDSVKATCDSLEEQMG